MDSVTQARALEVLDRATEIAADYGLSPTLGEVKGWLWVIGLALECRGPIPDPPPRPPNDDDWGEDEEDTEVE